MNHALEWMLAQVHKLSTNSNSTAKSLKLFEMYCGCGAHTCVFGKSDYIESIMAIELDQRLVDAANVNVKLNNLENCVKVYQDDAATVAKKGLPKYLKSKKNEDSNTTFDLLLVDPPRSGLDKTVCNFAMKESDFTHMIYISCGKEALVRDLAVLQAEFMVEAMLLTDLFPRTSSVETLVLLKRREQE